MQKTKPLSAEARATFWRTLQTFCVTRVVIALVLLSFLGLSTFKEAKGASLFDWTICSAYVLLAAAFTFFRSTSAGAIPSSC